MSLYTFLGFYIPKVERLYKGKLPGEFAIGLPPGVAGGAGEDISEERP